jgi:HAD superfamily (subfamily IA) hydrolase, TIGR02254
MYKYLFFDADDTVFDFRKAERLALSELFPRFGIADTEENHRLYVKENDACWKELEKGLMDAEELKSERFVRFFRLIGCKGDAKKAGEEQLLFLSHHGCLLNGAKETLSLLKERGYRLFLITNGYREVQRGRLEDAALLPFFEQVFISQELGVSKPDPAFFHYIDKRLSYDKKEALIIGDSLSSDIELGLRVGIDTCFVNRKHIATDKPKFQIESIVELLSLLD